MNKTQNLQSATTPSTHISAVSTFVINMRHSADRLVHMRSQLDALGIEWTRFEAVDGRAIPDSLKYVFDAEAGMKAGEIGCYASHLLICRRLVDEGGPAALVLEDDLLLAPDLAATLVDVLDALPPDWDIVRLSNPPKRAFLALRPVGSGRWLARYSRIPINTGAYLISRNGAAKFLSLACLRSRPIDVDLRRPWRFGLDVYGVVPPPVVSNIFDSVIDAIEDRRVRPRTHRRPWVLIRRPEEGPFSVMSGLIWHIRRVGLVGWLACAMRNMRMLLQPRWCRKDTNAIDRWRVGPFDSQEAVDGRPK